MQLIHLEAAVILGMLIPQISGNSVSPSACLAAVETCMSNLCKWSDEGFYGDICEGGSGHEASSFNCTSWEYGLNVITEGNSLGQNEGCQMKGSEVCNLTMQTVLDQFPSLNGCVCAWEEELCDSIQALATQCHHKPAQPRKSTAMDWKSSSLIGYEYDASASCMDRMRVCVSDTVCNRYVTPVITACMGLQCDRDRCPLAIQQFYGSAPRNVAEMLVMCECEASDRACLDVKTALHSGTCGGQTWICQDTVTHCVEDSHCRDLLKTFRARCWRPEEAQCSADDLRRDECMTRMDPALLRGADSGCRTAFLATLGSALHHPCACDGLRDGDLLTCNVIHDALHNRSRFMTSSRETTPPEIDGSEQSHTWSHDYLLYAFATVLLFGVVVLMPLAVVSKIWMLRRRDETKFHPPQKSVVIL